MEHAFTFVTPAALPVPEPPSSIVSLAIKQTTFSMELAKVIFFSILFFNSEKNPKLT